MIRTYPDHRLHFIKMLELGSTLSVSEFIAGNTGADIPHGRVSKDVSPRSRTEIE